MATTVAGRRLTEAHRLAQARLGVDTARQMIALARLLDPFDLDGTTEGWLRVATPLVARQNARSAQLAASYFRLFRNAEISATDYSATVTLTADAQRVAASLTATGPAVVRYDTARGLRPAEAFARATSTAAGAAQRLALDGGRATLSDNVRSDRRALGWQRVTSGNPCAFCLLIATRGPVYRQEDTAAFQAHDNCSCTAEPVYDRDTDLPPGAQAARDRWDEATQGFSGDDAINAFRRSLAESPL